VGEGKVAPWENAARRFTVGDKTELETIPGYWIKPKKYSVEGDNAIKAAAAGNQSVLPPSLLKRLQERAETMQDGELTQSELFKMMSAEEIGEMIHRTATADSAQSVKVVKLILMYGIDSHNFEDTDNRRCGEDLAEKLMQYRDAAMECVRIIQGFNGPLARATGQPSETSPNGNTEASDTSPTARTPQTEATPTD